MMYRLMIVIIFLCVSIYLIYLACDEKNNDYNDIYLRTIGTIVNKNIESKDIIENKDNIFTHIKKAPFTFANFVALCATSDVVRL